VTLNRYQDRSSAGFGRCTGTKIVPGKICDVEQVPGSLWGRICDVEQVPGCNRTGDVAWDAAWDAATSETPEGHHETCIQFSFFFCLHAVPTRWTFYACTYNVRTGCQLRIYLPGRLVARQMAGASFCAILRSGCEVAVAETFPMGKVHGANGQK